VFLIVYTGIFTVQRGQVGGEPTPEVVGLNIDVLRVGTACFHPLSFFFLYAQWALNPLLRSESLPPLPPHPRGDPEHPDPDPFSVKMLVQICV